MNIDKKKEKLENGKYNKKSIHRHNNYMYHCNRYN